MIAAAHAVVGAALAVSVTNPVVGLPLVLGSHFLLDMVPHWDFATNQKKSKKSLFWGAAFDVLLGFFLVLIFFGDYSRSLYFWSMVLVSQLPDWLEAPYMFLGLEKPFIWVKKLQNIVHVKMNLPWGIIIPAIVVVLVCWGILSTSGANFSTASIIPTITP